MVNEISDTVGTFPDMFLDISEKKLPLSVQMVLAEKRGKYLIGW